MRLGYWSRNAWKFLLALAGVIGLFGIGDVIVGVGADPAIALSVTGLAPDEIRAMNEPVHGLIDLQVRAGGFHLIVMSALWTMLILVPLRRGEAWSWYALWTLPLWGLAVSVAFLVVELQPDQPAPPPAISGWVFFGLASALLWAARSGVTRSLSR
ncbi:MAG TPA: hypothetical protein VLB67_06185 [Acidimicrobiia bacterium]|nr:hypothetical protein [Acidimicrobiia bacterium]